MGFLLQPASGSFVAEKNYSFYLLSEVFHALTDLAEQNLFLGQYMYLFC